MRESYRPNEPRPPGFSGATALDTALWALEAGLWPVVITPHDSKGPSPGKRPIGQKWGVERPTEQSLRAAFKRTPDAGVGLKLGAEGGVVDIDVDDPEGAEPVLARLFPDGTPDTLGWLNADGRFHLIFRYDARLASFGKSIIKGQAKAGGKVAGNASYVGLEIRIGAAPGDAKQLQSVIPPSRMANGKRRKWIGSEILPFPESILRDLEANARPEPTPNPSAPSKRYRHDQGHDLDDLINRRVVPYIRKADPAIEGSGGHDQTFKVCVKTGPGFNLDPETAFRLLWEEYNPTCQPPWSEKELRHKVEHAYKVETRRGWLLDEGRQAPRTQGGGPGTKGPRKPPAPPKPASEPEPEAPRARPTIEITTERHIAADQSLDALAADPDLYRRALTLVNVVRDKDDDAPQIVAISEAVISTRLTKFAEFVTWKRDRSGEEYSVPAHPPDWLIKAVATTPHRPQIRPLDAVAECPFPRADGSIVETPGYDFATRILYWPLIDFPRVPNRPSRDDARAAWARLSWYVRKFPFPTEEDRSVFLAGILTVIGRSAINGPVPGIAANGNKAGIGKGLLIDAMTIPGTGRNCPTQTYPEESDEARKVKVAIAKAGKVAVHFDNLDEGASYGSGAMDSALTTTVADERQLGTNDAPPLPLRPAWFLSGNNISPGKDAYRRWLVCNLVTDLEHPEQRDDLGDEDLRGLMMRDRARCVLDALTILRAHALAGWPNGGWPLMGSFEQWDRVVRGAVWFATGCDCLTTQRRMAEDSPDRQRKLALLQGWAELTDGREGGRGMTAAEAVAHAKERREQCPTLWGALLERGRGGEPITGARLGFALRGLKNSLIGGYMVKEIGKRHGSAIWVVSVPRDPDPGRGG